MPEILAVSDETGRFLELPSQNGLLAAVHLAFSQHLPLTLSPDIIWIAILQGFARHVRVNAAQLEGRLMSHPGKHVIEIVISTTEWEWTDVFDQFAAGLENHAGEWVRHLQSDFSTTSVVERAASQVALMDVFSPYVQYIMHCICGIPSITLRGTEADWMSLRGKLALLRGYDADEWVDEIDEIVGRFVDASRGEVDREWWKQIYKLNKRYGGEDLEGWLGAFFPYLRDDRWYFTRRREKGDVFTTDSVPPGVSDVAVKFIAPVRKESLRVIGGFVGVEYFGAAGVMPKIGWAVARGNYIVRFVEGLAERPGIKVRPSRFEKESEADEFSPGICMGPDSLPIDVQIFYRATDGADFYGKVQIHPLATLLHAPTVSPSWGHLGIWADGSLLLLKDTVVRAHWIRHAWEHRTIASTFSEFVARLVSAEGNEYWNEANFIEPEPTDEWAAFRSPATQGRDVAKTLDLIRRQNGRLRSMKVVRHDVFLIRSALTELPVEVPFALHSFYTKCDGVAQVEGFEIWSARRVTAVPGLHDRWFEIGAAPGYRILFDIAGGRGVAVLKTANRLIGRVAKSFEAFFELALKCPQSLFWENLETEEFEKPIFWPDEDVKTLLSNPEA